MLFRGQMKKKDSGSYRNAFCENIAKRLKSKISLSAPAFAGVFSAHILYLPQQIGKQNPREHRHRRAGSEVRQHGHGKRAAEEQAGQGKA